MENRVLREIYSTFYYPDKATEEYHQIEELHKKLCQKLSRKNRRRVLRIIDLKDMINDDQTFESFILGFRLALVLSQELGQNGGYPFDFEV